MSAELPPGPTHRRRHSASPARLRVRLPRRLAATIIEHCRSALPLEACGLLLGLRDGATAEITEALPAANTRASPDRYEIAPETVLAADRRARDSGQLLLGAWHSHPGGEPVPSDTDRAEAWPDWCYLIVGLADPEQPQLRAWRLLGEDFVADALEIE